MQLLATYIWSSGGGRVRPAESEALPKKAERTPTKNKISMLVATPMQLLATYIWTSGGGCGPPNQRHCQKK